MQRPTFPTALPDLDNPHPNPPRLRSPMARNASTNAQPRHPMHVTLACLAILPHPAVTLNPRPPLFLLNCSARLSTAPPFVLPEYPPNPPTLSGAPIATSVHMSNNLPLL